MRHSVSFSYITMFSGNKISNLLQKFTPLPIAFKTCTLQMKNKALLQYRICYYKTLEFPEDTTATLSIDLFLLIMS